MTNNYKPKGYPTLIPYMAVLDGKKSIEFYQNAFGFKLASEAVMEKGIVQHAEMQLGDCYIMFAPEGAYGSPAQTATTSKNVQGINLYIYVPDVDAHYSHAKKSGAKIIMLVDDMFWGDRMYQTQCIYGYMWSFATRPNSAE